MGVEDRGAEERGKGRTRPPGAGPLHQIEIDDFRRDRLLAALTLILGAAFCLGLPFALQAGAEFFLPLTAAIVIAIALVPVLEWLERDRKSVVKGKRVSVRVDLGGRRN